MSSLLFGLPTLDGAHILYVYNDQDKYMENATHFIGEGLANGEKIIIIEEDDFFSIVKEKLLHSGYNEEQLASLVFMNNTDYYVKHNEFNVSDGLKLLTSTLENYLELKHQIRIWGRVLTHNSTIFQIRNYEYACDNFMRGKAITSVCSYNGLHLSATIQNELLKVHQYFMLDDAILASPLYESKHSQGISMIEHQRLQKLEDEISLLKKKNEALIEENTTHKIVEEKLQLAKYAAEKANEMKNNFLSQMSHDLRTPLNTIQGYTQILLSEDHHPKLKHRLTKIEASTKHLLTLIEEILDFSAIESDKVKINYQNIHISSFIKECVDTLCKQINCSLPVIIHPISDSLYVEADPTRLQQIIYNLLTNAVKYNSQEEIIQIHVHEEINKVHISIEDKGIGIAQEELSDIFLPFYRSSSDHSPWKGTGLGLAIVARLTKKMNGSYGVKSSLGEGSTFWVSFNKPASHPLQIAEQEMNITLPDQLASNLRVLYIEDNKDNMELMHEMLDSIGEMMFIPASSGKIGLSLASKLKPDVILLDLGLPDISGLEVLERIKSDKLSKDIPVIIVSADALQTSMELAKKLGGADYITKPINIIKLKESLFRYLQGKRPSEE